MDNTVAVLTIISVSFAILIAVCTLFGLISKSIKKSFKTTMKTENDRQAEGLKAEFNTKIQILTKELSDFKTAKCESDSKLRNASIASARDRLHQAYNQFMPLGRIDEHTLYCIVELAEAYEDLGGNSFVEDEIKELQQMYINNLKHKENRFSNYET